MGTMTRTSGIMGAVKKAVAILITAIFTATTVQAAPNVYTITVPDENGTVAQRFKGTSDKVIIHIQDAHSNLDAQVNLAKIVCTLVPQIGKDNPFIGIEGAIGGYDLKVLRDFPVQSVKESVGRDFVKNGTFVGSEYASIIAPEDFTLYGLEETDTLKRNYEAFCEVMQRQAILNAELERMGAYLTILKKVLYAADLAAFDEAATAYEANATDMLKHLGPLYQQIQDLGLDLISFVNLAQFKEVYITGRQIDQTVLDRELDALVSVLTAPVTDPALAADAHTAETNTYLATAYEDYTTQKLSQQQIVMAVTSVAITRGMTLDEAYPMLTAARKYWSGFARIDFGSLMRDMRSANTAVRMALAQTKEEQLIVELWDKLMTLKQLMSLQAVQADVDSFRADTMKYSIAFLYKGAQVLSSRCGVPLELVPPAVEIEHIAAVVGEFYRLAEERNQILVDNLLAQMDANGQTVGVLVAGGFHSDGMTSILRDRGISYLTITPAIDSLTADVAYMDRMIGSAPVANTVLPPSLVSRLNLTKTGRAAIAGAGAQGELQHEIRTVITELVETAVKSASIEAINGLEVQLRKYLAKHNITDMDEKLSSIIGRLKGEDVEFGVGEKAAKQCVDDIVAIFDSALGIGAGTQSMVDDTVQKDDIKGKDLDSFSEKKGSISESSNSTFTTPINVGQVKNETPAHSAIAADQSNVQNPTDLSSPVSRGDMASNTADNPMGQKQDASGAIIRDNGSFAVDGRSAQDAGVNHNAGSQKSNVTPNTGIATDTDSASGSLTPAFNNAYATVFGSEQGQNPLTDQITRDEHGTVHVHLGHAETTNTDGTAASEQAAASAQQAIAAIMHTAGLSSLTTVNGIALAGRASDIAIAADGTIFLTYTAADGSTILGVQIDAQGLITATAGETTADLTSLIGQVGALQAMLGAAQGVGITDLNMHAQGITGTIGSTNADGTTAIAGMTGMTYTQTAGIAQLSGMTTTGSSVNLSGLIGILGQLQAMLGTQQGIATLSGITVTATGTIELALNTADGISGLQGTTSLTWAQNADGIGQLTALTNVGAIDLGALVQQLQSLTNALGISIAATDVIAALNTGVTTPVAGVSMPETVQTLITAGSITAAIDTNGIVTLTAGSTNGSQISLNTLLAQIAQVQDVCSAGTVTLGVAGTQGIAFNVTGTAAGVAEGTEGVETVTFMSGFFTADAVMIDRGAGTDDINAMVSLQTIMAAYENALGSAANGYSIVGVAGDSAERFTVTVRTTDGSGTEKIIEVINDRTIIGDAATMTALKEQGADLAEIAAIQMKMMSKYGIALYGNDIRTIVIDASLNGNQTLMQAEVRADGTLAISQALAGAYTSSTEGILWNAADERAVVGSLQGNTMEYQLFRAITRTDEARASVLDRDSDSMFSHFENMLSDASMSMLGQAERFATAFYTLLAVSDQVIAVETVETMSDAMKTMASDAARVVEELQQEDSFKDLDDQAMREVVDYMLGLDWNSDNVRLVIDEVTDDFLARFLAKIMDVSYENLETELTPLFAALKKAIASPNAVLVVSDEIAANAWAWGVIQSAASLLKIANVTTAGDANKIADDAEILYVGTKKDEWQTKTTLSGKTNVRAVALGDPDSLEYKVGIVYFSVVLAALVTNCQPGETFEIKDIFKNIDVIGTNMKDRFLKIAAMRKTVAVAA